MGAVHVMPGNNITAGQRPSGSPAKVFISYAREDHAIAEELVAGLELCGFAAYLDKEDIAPGEPWEERLRRLIREADTVVFVISPDSVASHHCSWEVEETKRLSKRLLPMVYRPVPEDEVPGPLRRLNYVFFNQSRSFTRSLGDLVRALRVDLEWIREHTRLGDLAARWEQRGRPVGLLLRDEEVKDTTLWVAQRPLDGPEITLQQQAFLDASVRAAEAELRRRIMLRWRAKAATIAAAAILAVGAAVSTLAWFRANEARKALKERVDELRAANLRLSRNIALRVAPTGDQAYVAGQNWYQIATDYAGAIAIIRAKGGAAPPLTGSGFIVRGSALHPSWGGETVFVTASFVIGESGLKPHEATAYFPGLEGESHAIEFAKTLWERPFRDGGLGVSVLRIKGALPFAAKPIERVRTRGFEALPEAGLKPPGVKKGAMGHALATVGYGAVSTGFALFLHSLVGWADKDAWGRPLRLCYSHVSEGGTAGAPVFDVETGELVAVHQSGAFARGPADGNVRLGEGAAVSTVIATIKYDLGMPSGGSGRFPDAQPLDQQH